jgi:hypothetical protein
MTFLSLSRNKNLQLVAKCLFARSHYIFRVFIPEYKLLRSTKRVDEL